jgi:hypothetical protein
MVVMGQSVVGLIDLAQRTARNGGPAGRITGPCSTAKSSVPRQGAGEELELNLYTGAI